MRIDEGSSCKIQATCFRSGVQAPFYGKTFARQVPCVITFRARRFKTERLTAFFDVKHLNQESVVHVMQHLDGDNEAKVRGYLEAPASAQ